MKFFSAIILLFTAQLAFGQATLTGTNLNPVAGESIPEYICDRPYPSPGSDGSNITWDFHDITATQVDTTIYYDCSATPECDYFSGSNLANQFHSYGVSATYDGYIYESATEDSLYKIGSYYNGLDTVHYSGGIIMKYPFTYTSFFNGIATLYDHAMSSTGPDYLEYGTDTFYVSCDGFGQLILPNGTYNNVLRAHRTERGFDSLITSNTDVLHFINTIFYWYTPGHHGPLLTIAYRSSTQTAQPGVTTIDTVISYTYGLPSAVPTISNGAQHLSVYPNPTTNLLNIKFTTTETTPITITLLDIFGKEITAITNSTFTPGDHTLTYNTSSLPKGLYLLQLKSNTENITQKLQVQ